MLLDNLSERLLALVRTPCSYSSQPSSSRGSSFDLPLELEGMLLSEVVTLKMKGMSRPQPLFLLLLLALTLLPKKPLLSLAQLLVQGEPHPE